MFYEVNHDNEQIKTVHTTQPREVHFNTSSARAWTFPVCPARGQSRPASRFSYHCPTMLRPSQTILYPHAGIVTRSLGSRRPARTRFAPVRQEIEECSAVANDVS